MRKTKWTRLAAMALSATMVFSSLQLPAFAAGEEEIPAITQTVSVNDEEYGFEEESQTTPESAPAETQEETPLPSETPMNLDEADPYNNMEEVEPDPSTLGDLSQVEPFSISMNGDAESRARSGNTRAAISIDPSDLTNWYVFDHYDWWGDKQKNVILSGGSYSKGPRYDAPAGWGSANKWNNNKAFNPAKHPWSYYSQEATQFSGHYNLSNPTEIAAYEKLIFDEFNRGRDYAITQVSQHIYTTGTKENAQIKFTGYYTPAYVDWILADIPDNNTDLKSISFDIDAKYVVPHSMSGFGIFVNSGIAGDTFKGHAIYFQAGAGSPFLTSLTPQIIDMSAGSSASKMHTNPSSADSWYYNGGMAGTRTNIAQVNGSTQITFPSTLKKIHVDIQVNMNNANQSVLDLKVYRFTSETQYDQTPIINYQKVLNNTGHASFGPFAHYRGHNCTELTYVSFDSMQLSTNLNVYFWTDKDRGNNFHTTEGVEKGESMQSMLNKQGNSFEMPKAPSQPGKAFLGWIDDQGNPFTKDTPINNTTNVYAVWGNNSVSASYNPNNQWTNKNVDVIVEVVAGYSPQQVTVDFGDGTSISVPTHKDPATGRYIGQVQTPKNVTNGKVTAVVSDGQGGFDSVYANVKVSWIDKAAPVVSNLPKGNPTTGILTSTDIKNNVKFEDFGTPDGSLNGETKSGINDNSKLVYFYDENKNPIGNGVSYAQLDNHMKNMTGGRYYYAVSVLDKAGNYGDSNGKTGDATGTVVPKPEKPTEGPIVINATNPTIKETGRSATLWTNQDVTVNYEVTSTTKLTNVTADGTVNTNPKTPQTGQFVYTKNGVKTVSAVNIANLDAKENFEVRIIDKINPEIADNIPDRADTAAEITSKVTYSDPKDTDGRASGIKSGTETLYIYKNENDSKPWKTISMANLASEWGNIPAGKYYYAVSVKDDANNYTDSNGKQMSNAPGGATELPDKPTGSIIIKADKPQITGSMKTDKDQASYTEKQWTNQDVIVDYNVDSSIELDYVKKDGNNQTISSSDGKTHHGSTTITQEGKTTIKVEAGNEVGEANPKIFEIWIDKTKPVVNYPTSGSELDKIVDEMTFIDEPNGSGIETGSEIIIIKDKSGAPVLTGNKSDVDAGLPNLATGEYTIETTVKDKAGNTSVPKIDGPVPHIKDGDNGLGISITYAPTNTNPTNKDVVATYTITSSLPLTSVTVGGQKVSVSGKGHTGTITFTANGEKEIVAITAGGEEKETAEVTWIDKINPKAELPASNTIFDASDISLNDIPDAEGWSSGIKADKTELIAIPYENGKPGTSITINSTKKADIDAKLDAGKVYDLTLKGADEATNPSNTAVAKGVMYLPDKKNPPTASASDFTVTKLPGDMGTGEIAVKISNVASSSAVPIKDVYVEINGVNQGSKMIPTPMGQAATTVEVRFGAKVKATDTINFIVHLHTGKQVSVPYTHTAPAPPAATGNGLKTAGAVNTGNTITYTALMAAIDGGSDITWQDGTSMSNYTLYYKNGARVVVTTSATLKNLSKVVERQVFIVSKDASGKTYYLGGAGATGEGIPAASVTGIKVKG